jgi:hypothetical protein
MQVLDVVRYNEGWVSIFTFQAKGDTWYIAIPAERTKVEALTRGQKAVKSGSN